MVDRGKSIVFMAEDTEKCFKSTSDYERAEARFGDARIR